MKVARFIVSIVERNITVFSNFSFLGISQVVNLLLFIVLIPFLFRKLGTDLYGLVVFAQTVAFYFSIVINFGFNVSGTRDISIKRDDIESRGRTIFSILILKSTFLILSFGLLAAMSLFIPLINNNTKLFFLSMLFCVGEAFFPVWYFQGIEKMKYITYINVVTRTLSTIAIFLFVKSPDDYLLVPLFFGIGYVTAAAAGLVVVYVFHKNKIIFSGVEEIVRYLRINIPLFLSNVSTQIYANANKLIIGSFMGMQEVGIYDAAEKITNLFKVPVMITGQVLFPKVARERNTKWLFKVIWIVIAYFIAGYTTLIFFSERIIAFVTDGAPGTSLLVLLLALSVLPVCVGLFYSDLLLVAYGYLKEYAIMRISTLCFYLFLSFVAVATGIVNLYVISGIVVLTECYVLVHSVMVVRRLKILE